MIKQLVWLLLVTYLGLSAVGCTTTGQQIQNRNDALVSKSVYATDDSIKAKRYDLAKSYSAQTIRLVPPPKASDRIKITPVTMKKAPSKTEGKSPPTKPANSANNPVTEPDYTETNQEVPVVVLPAEDANAKVIVENSPEYQALLKDKETERLAKEALQSQVDQLLLDKENYRKEQLAKEGQKTWWDKIKSFFGWGGLFGTLGLIGLGVLFFLNPALFFVVISLIKNIIVWILGRLKIFIAYFNDKWFNKPKQ